MELKKRFRITRAEYNSLNFFHIKNRLIAIPVIFIVLMPVTMMVLWQNRD